MESIDKKKIYRLLIILSWVVLVFYLLLKLLFGYTLEIVCNNERILAICNFIDSNAIATYICASIFCFIMLYFYYGGILRKVKLNKKEIIILLITTIIANLCTYFGVVGMIVSDVLKLFVAPMIMLGKFKWKNLLVCFIFFVLNLSFQLISTITANIGVKNIENNSLSVIILSIDFIIMLILTCLYRKEK